MKIAVSILNAREPVNEEVKKISNLDVEYMHIDVMDGIFVENRTYNFEEYSKILSNVKKPKDVHLMVSDVKKYIDDFSKLNPEYITFHYEAVSEIFSVISYIKEKGIKVGISIKPLTDIMEIKEYLKFVDLVLIMSVEPGKGGQEFILDSVNKINMLKELKDKFGYKYVIEVDGGINNETIKVCNNADICVVGSYITKNVYEDAIRKLRD